MVARLFDLSGRVALVTGASRGIGRGIAEGLAEAGADIALVSRDAAGLAEVADRVRALGRRAEVVPADVGRMEDVRGLVGRVLERFVNPQLDILVNVAGTNRRKPAVEITEDDWDLVLDVNLKAAFFVTQAVGRYWIESGRFADGRHGKGKVINVTSLTSVIGIRSVAPYAASKSGLLGITRVLALEWAPHHICVNGLAPGYIRTALTRPVFDDPALSAWIHSRIPAGQAGSPSDLVGAAVFLAAPASDYLTGQNLPVDGGWLAG